MSWSTIVIKNEDEDDDDYCVNHTTVDNILSTSLIPLPKKLKVEWNNYIPHKTKKTDYNIWQDKYENHLLSMLSLVKETIDESGIKHNINWQNPTVYESLAHLVYMRSSKHV